MTSGVIAACTWGRSAVSDATELLTLGRRLSGRFGGELAWVIVGAPPPEAVETAGRHGATVAHVISSSELDVFQPDLYVEALTQYCRSHCPKLLLFPQTYDVRLLAPRLAARLGSGVVMNGLDVGAGEDGRVQVTASAYGGDTHATYVFSGGQPHIVSMMPNAVRATPSETPSSPAVRMIYVDLASVKERIRVVSPARSEGPRLEDAQIIVAGGRGLGNAASFALIEELAAALGGMAAASRPIVDDGWTDASRQVGLTGKITRPALYIAAGISGASQHMAGCSAAKVIVAINRDPDAAIFRYARFGAVGDCLEIIPEMIRAARRRPI